MYLASWNYRQVTPQDRKSYITIQNGSYVMYEEGTGKYLWNRSEKRPWTAGLRYAQDTVEQLNKGTYQLSPMEEIRVP